jgi:chromosome segregation ATPase
MASTFGVKVEDEVKASWDSIIEKMAQPGETKGDTLARIFALAEDQLDSERLKTGGADVEALDATLSHLRSMFVALVGGKAELAASYEEKVQQVKESKDKAEIAYLDQIAKLKSELGDAGQIVSDAERDVASAIKDRDNAVKQAQSQADLAASTKKNNEMLVNEVTTLKEQLSGYAALKESEASLKASLSESERHVAELQKEMQRSLKELEAEYNHKLEQAHSAAALETEKALAKKDKETDAVLKDSYIKIAKLEAQVEMLNNQLLELKNEKRAE